MADNVTIPTTPVVIDLTGPSLLDLPNTVPVASPVDVIIGIHTPNLSSLPACSSDDVPTSIQSQETTSGALLLKWLVHLACLKRTWAPNMNFDEFDEHLRKCEPFDDDKFWPCGPDGIGPKGMFADGLSYCRTICLTHTLSCKLCPFDNISTS
jgi:hypothetical protein